MKQHIVNVRYNTDFGNYFYTGFVPESIVNGKCVFYPVSLFKQKFGFELPIGSTISHG